MSMQIHRAKVGSWTCLGILNVGWFRLQQEPLSVVTSLTPRLWFHNLHIFLFQIEPFCTLTANHIILMLILDVSGTWFFFCCEKFPWLFLFLTRRRFRHSSKSLNRMAQSWFYNAHSFSASLIFFINWIWTPVLSSTHSRTPFRSTPFPWKFK